MTTNIIINRYEQQRHQVTNTCQSLNLCWDLNIIKIFADLNDSRGRAYSYRLEPLLVFGCVHHGSKKYYFHIVVIYSCAHILSKH